MYKLKITLSALAFGLALFIFACDEPPPQAKKKISSPNVVSKKISQPKITKKPPKKVNKNDSDKKNNETLVKDQSVIKKDQQPVAQKSEPQKDEQYDPKGKIDPFRPLIQERTEEAKLVVDDRPKRILTPLEKIDLSQIRLVAVILMENKQIAMVEEASGKGYEIGIGTYIGKNQGRVAEIKRSSIIIKELVRDYKGRLKELVQEIKLHKTDNEG